MKRADPYLHIPYDSPDANSHPWGNSSCILILSLCHSGSRSRSRSGVFVTVLVGLIMSTTVPYGMIPAFTFTFPPPPEESKSPNYPTRGCVVCGKGEFRWLAVFNCRSGFDGVRYQGDHPSVHPSIYCGSGSGRGKWQGGGVLTALCCLLVCREVLLDFRARPGWVGASPVVVVPFPCRRRFTPLMSGLRAPVLRQNCSFPGNLSKTTGSSQLFQM